MNSNLSWWQNKVKGSISEAICAIHFQAAGFTVSETGIEKTVPDFAQRDRAVENGNSILIQEHIGYLPDFLVQHPALPSYFVEVKFRSSLVDAQHGMADLILELLWNYKNLIFRKYESHVFGDISPTDWHRPIGASSLSEELKDRFRNCIKSKGHLIAPDMLRLPLLFYLVAPSDNDGMLKTFLACPSFFENTFCYRSYPIHVLADDQDVVENEYRDLLAQLRKVWQGEILPALSCMFPYLGGMVGDDVREDEKKKSVAPEYEQAATNGGRAEFQQFLFSHARVIADDNNRYGAYLSELLARPIFLDELAVRFGPRLNSIDDFLGLLRVKNIQVREFSVSEEEKRYYLYLASIL